MDACVTLRSLLEALRVQRRRASLSLSSLSTSSSNSIGTSGCAEDIRLDGKLEVTAFTLVPKISGYSSLHLLDFQ